MKMCDPLSVMMGVATVLTAVTPFLFYARKIQRNELKHLQKEVESIKEEIASLRERVARLEAKVNRYG